ncbi:Nitrile-specifier protein 4 [Thelohanellus kitauei]|uniref:Nitrile-specifier protein 4 n=1 Tax=Thelohanellus kitauei TaxID=669202 RepID=A0A0C2N2N9_THEKT|nr:Nitrile-specifier protein 4 [Thelohanellus kitauei]
MSSFDEFLIMYGGMYLSTKHHLDELWIYNTLSRIWKRHQTPIYPTKTCVYSSICVVGNLVYIFGGQHLQSPRRCTNSLVSFDIKKETWQLLSPHIDENCQNKPPPMSANLLCYHHGSLYVFGGFDVFGPVDTIYKFCLTTLTWSLVEYNGIKHTLSIPNFGTVYKNQYCF